MTLIGAGIGLTKGNEDWAHASKQRQTDKECSISHPLPKYIYRVIEEHSHQINPNSAVFFTWIPLLQARSLENMKNLSLGIFSPCVLSRDGRSI